MKHDRKHPHILIAGLSHPQSKNVLALKITV